MGKSKKGVKKIGLGEFLGDTNRAYTVQDTLPSGPRARMYVACPTRLTGAGMTMTLDDVDSTNANLQEVIMSVSGAVADGWTIGGDSNLALTIEEIPTLALMIVAILRSGRLIFV